MFVTTTHFPSDLILLLATESSWTLLPELDWGTYE